MRLGVAYVWLPMARDDIFTTGISPEELPQRGLTVFVSGKLPPPVDHTNILREPNFFFYSFLCVFLDGGAKDYSSQWTHTLHSLLNNNEASRQHNASVNRNFSKGVSFLLHHVSFLLHHHSLGSIVCSLVHPYSLNYKYTLPRGNPASLKCGKREAKQRGYNPSRVPVGGLDYNSLWEMRPCNLLSSIMLNVNVRTRKRPHAGPPES